jgi:hypothetical protein
MRLNLNTPSIPNYLHVFILGLLPVLCGLGAMALGKDTNWDLRNYHYYNAYAFVNQRYDLDIAPAQLQTFYNPLLDLPFYFMAQAFPARRIGFILGCVHGLNLSIIYLIFCNLTRYAGRYTQMLIGLGVVAVSAIAPGFLSELGGTMNDNVASLGVLFAILLLFSAHDQAPGHSRWRNGYVMLAGLVMGLTVGLKPVTAIYAIGTALSLPLLFPTWRSWAICFLLYGLAGAVGGVASSGFWWWELWSRFGNPVFPYFNNIFKSPYVLAGRYNDMVFVPRQA